MALSQAEIELLATLSDEKERDSYARMLEGFPALRERIKDGLRQEDYSRKMNEVSAQEKQFKEDKAKIETARDAALASARKWEEWGLKSQPVHENVIAANRQLLAEAKAKDDEIAKLSEGRGIDMDLTELNSTLDTRFNAFEAKYGQRPDAEHIKQMVNEEVAKLVQAQANQLEERFLKETFPKTLQFQTGVVKAMNRHFREFGEDLDEADLLKYMADNKLDDPLKAHDGFVTEKRRTAELAKFEKDKREAVDTAVKEALSKVRVPGSGAIPGPTYEETGVLQMRDLHPEVVTQKPDEVRVGAGRLAQLAATELINEGKG